MVRILAQLLASDTVESAKADCEKRCKASYNRVARNAAKQENFNVRNTWQIGYTKVLFKVAKIEPFGAMFKNEKALKKSIEYLMMEVGIAYCLYKK